MQTLWSEACDRQNLQVCVDLVWFIMEESIARHSFSILLIGRGLKSFFILVGWKDFFCCFRPAKEQQILAASTGYWSQVLTIWHGRVKQLNLKTHAPSIWKVPGKVVNAHCVVWRACARCMCSCRSMERNTWFRNTMFWSICCCVQPLCGGMWLVVSCQWCCTLELAAPM